LGLYHISGLLLCFFAINFPELIKAGMVYRGLTPIIIATKGQDKKYYYSLNEYENDIKKLTGYHIKYNKGLGGLTNEDYKEMLQNMKLLKFDMVGQNDLDAIYTWFDKSTNMRKEILILCSVYNSSFHQNQTKCEITQDNNRKFAINVENSMNYIKCIKYKNSNRINYLSLQLLEKLDIFNKTSKRSLKLSSLLAIFSVTFVDVNIHKTYYVGSILEILLSYCHFSKPQLFKNQVISFSIHHKLV
jgi:hypothetical protein